MKSLNATFVALIPKKAGAMDIKDSYDSDMMECASTLGLTFFFFEKSIELNKRAEGRNPWYTRSIQRGFGGKREEREKIRKTNHSRGQPPRSPSEKCKKEQMEKFLM